MSPVGTDTLAKVTDIYPMRINPYVLSLIKEKGPSIARQYIPDPRELEDSSGMADPLGEEADSPVPGITHRYPDRVLFLISGVCPSICRFCTRKRKVGKWPPVTREEIERGIRYIEDTQEIRDVLLSGGDPLLLGTGFLETIISRIHAVPHVDIIRIGTRTITALPQRITPDLVAMLRRYQPLYINFHINHPDEITPQMRKAVDLLVDSGIVLGSQTVLLRGINDNAATIERLMRGLVRIRVRPYYLLQGDLVQGTEHFRTKIQTGIDIIRQMRGWVSGLANPQYVIDLPWGGGKIPVVPRYIQSMTDTSIEAENFRGNVHCYPQPDTEKTGEHEKQVD